MFINTGLEYPEIVDFVKRIPNIDIIRPKMTFKEVIDKFGYPVISKEQSNYIYEYRNSKSEYTRNLRLNGNEKGGFRISKKYLKMIEAPFKISHMCCYKLKKDPSKLYERETGCFPFIGIMAEDSMLRQTEWKKHGCNSFDTKRPQSRPLMVWTEKDIWDYISQTGIEYCDIYDKGIKNTGCIFCMYGLQYQTDKFEILKRIHPKLYDYCMDNLGLGDVIDFMKRNNIL